MCRPLLVPAGASALIYSPGLMDRIVVGENTILEICTLGCPSKLCLTVHFYFFFVQALLTFAPCCHSEINTCSAVSSLLEESKVR